MRFLKKGLSAFLIGFCFSVGACSPDEAEPPVNVAIVPSFFKLPAGGEVQLAAEVTGTSNKMVDWRVNGPGAITADGLYTAPPTVDPNRPTATIQATSQAAPAVMGNGAVTMTTVTPLPENSVPPSSNQTALGGFTVRAGQTIDLNGDNQLDLVTASSTQNAVRIFFGVGNGNFLFKADISVSEPVAIAVADFINNPDFWADVAVASAMDQNISIIGGKKAENNIPEELPAIRTTLPLPAIPSAMTAGGFHGDPTSNIPVSDLAVGTVDGAIHIYLQDRTDNSYTPAPFLSVGAKPLQIAPVDFNQDDLLDLAVVREGANDLLIFLGDGAGGFSGPTLVLFSSAPGFIAVGDFNEDQTPDLAATHPAANQVSISLGKGDGAFQPASYTTLESSPGSIIAGDFNLGGNDDIAVTLPASKAVLLLFGDGIGNLIGKWRYNAGVPPISLISGFFTSFQSPTGFQSVGLIYINQTDNRFYLLNNVSQ
ncbi:MAG TPA: VCBS repeat-containing protein [Candidatus Manganitrophaceae bacterium]|nr:VCBS repeat-containing protein [Candidatus Manganitrophaceae bacterium]